MMSILTGLERNLIVVAAIITWAISHRVIVKYIKPPPGIEGRFACAFLALGMTITTWSAGLAVYGICQWVIDGYLGAN